jgi:hypothetical protein
MILRAISGYLSDHGVENEYDDGLDHSCVAVFDESRLESRLLTIHTWDGTVSVVDKTYTLVLCDVSDPDLFVKVLGAVREYRGACDDS